VVSDAGKVENRRESNSGDLIAASP